MVVVVTVAVWLLAMIRMSIGKPMIASEIGNDKPLLCDHHVHGEREVG